MPLETHHHIARRVDDPRRVGDELVPRRAQGLLSGPRSAPRRWTTPDPARCCRAGLWGLLAAKLMAGWGLEWDAQWHVLVGRDSFWIPPHLLLYAGVTMLGLLTFGVLACETLGSRGGAPREGTIRMFGIVGTIGFHLAAWGVALLVLAAPIDDIWHRSFGRDATIWSPPHLMGLLGAALNTVGCLVIATETYRAGTWARLLAVLLADALLYGGLLFTVEPAIHVAYRHSGVGFHTYAILATLLLPLPLIIAVRLSARREAPLLLVVVFVLMNLGAAQVARAGFAWFKHETVATAEMTRDPAAWSTALTREIAAKNRTRPGDLERTLAMLALIPAAVMVAVNPRRRPVSASVAFAIVFLGVSTWVLAQSPALAPHIPTVGATLVALLLTVTAAILGSFGACRVAEVMFVLGHARLSFAKLEDPSADPEAIAVP